ncbi:50S ribosomal subunit L30 [Patellaria atrata CBS 101060]|uniref:Large ribosomal subunit protein mL46 n=1 Tax=Patellaria atrata CBS 101060 TaxID=1346257 RepID=A0A9P4S659_9PEZI|nr:50S ribosomal subunit L30 [Patellaria atrata CBS 101060]
MRRIWSSLSQNPSICTSCLVTISQRRHASATAVAIAEDNSTPPQTTHIPPVSEAASPKTAYQLRAGVVLSRPPQITRDLTPFEKSFFLYQRRLNERLALPFTRYFYFKKDTPADVDWKRKIKTRLTPARDIGVYNPYSKEGWHDELLVGDRTSEVESQVEALLKDAEVEAVGDKDAQEQEQVGGGKKEAVERPMPRETEADRKGDVRSLDRKLARTLYLLVKDKTGRWCFPSDRLVGKEILHLAAERIIVQAGGINMNTWVVGNAPVGHYSRPFRTPVVDSAKGIEELGEKVFFMKARILAGQANLKENALELTDFQWLAKEEIEGIVTPEYWSDVKNMLATR